MNIKNGFQSAEIIYEKIDYELNYFVEIEVDIDISNIFIGEQKWLPNPEINLKDIF